MNRVQLNDLAAAGLLAALLKANDYFYWVFTPRRGRVSEAGHEQERRQR